MKKKYSYGMLANIVYFLLINFVVLVVDLTLKDYMRSHAMLYPFLFVIFIAFYVNFISIRFCIDEKGLGNNGMFFKRFINWNEVTHIKAGIDFNNKWIGNLLNPLLFILFRPITVSSQKSDILLNYGIKQYNKLLREIMEKCKDNPGIVIDSNVLRNT